jgi:GNAT superfamily N-acetyltransferase
MSLPLGAAVSCYCEDFESTLPATVEDLDDASGRARVHFVGQDPRLDLWVPYSALSDAAVDPPAPLPPFPPLSRFKNVHAITLGDRYTIPAWFFSPYPPEHARAHLFVCDQCCAYFGAAAHLAAHRAGACARPPGTELYRSGALSVFELSGVRQKVAAQCLCLLGRLYDDAILHYYDVEPLLFYALFECDGGGAHVCGFFSRDGGDPGEAFWDLVVLPPYARRAYDRLLVSIAYSLARRARAPARPHCPIPPAYLRPLLLFWRGAVAAALEDGLAQPGEIAAATGICEADVRRVLRAVGAGGSGPRVAPPPPECPLDERQLIALPEE